MWAIYPVLAFVGVIFLLGGGWAYLDGRRFRPLPHLSDEQLRNIRMYGTLNAPPCQEQPGDAKLANDFFFPTDREWPFGTKSDMHRLVDNEPCFAHNRLWFHWWVREM